MHDHASGLTMGLAFLLGVLHALEPGHGKTAMLAYLLSGKKGRWQPVVMGIATAVSHSISLFSLALVVHLTYHVATGDHHHEQWIARVFQVTSAVLILLVGVYLLIQAVRNKLHVCCAGGSINSKADKEKGQTSTAARFEARPCGCQSGIVDSHESDRASYKTTAVLGLAVGLLPCPSALAAFFSGLSSGSPAAAYAIVAVFSAGIACSLAAAGLAVQHFGERFGKKSEKLSGLPWAHLRAALILGVGLFYLASSIIG